MTDRVPVPDAAASGTYVLGGAGGDPVVNRLGFGAMRLTGRGILGEPEDPEEARRVLRRAVELGVNFIDTADSYGPEVSERLISEALHPYPEDLVIATKGGYTRPNGRWVPDGRPEHLREACEGSLRRLGVDRIDLYQLHAPDPEVPFEDSVWALAQLRDEGKIRHVGLSNVGVRALESAIDIVPVVSVQNRYNLTHRSSEAAGLRAGGGRVHTLVPTRHGQAGEARRAARRDRRQTRSHPLAGSARVAARTFVRDAAHPWHLVGRAPGGERRRRRAGAHG